MNRYGLFYLLALLLVMNACDQKQAKISVQAEKSIEAPPTSTNSTEVDSLAAANRDIIDTTVAGFSLKAQKTKQTICLTYRLSRSEKQQVMQFQYGSNSDIVFPNVALGVLRPVRYQQARFYLLRNKLLILPLMGINNLIAVYIINLDTQEVLASDLRTSFDLVWIHDKKMSFLTTDTPTMADASDQVKYVVNEYSITESSVKLMSRDSVLAKDFIKSDLQAQLAIARRSLE